MQTRATGGGVTTRAIVGMLDGVGRLPARERGDRDRVAVARWRTART
jgi:hypothetical protein